MSATDVTGADRAAVDDAGASGDRVLVGPPPTERRWTPRRIVMVLAPALIYLAIRELGLLVLSAMSAANDMSMSQRLQAWDGEWFRAIADGGYDGVPGYFTNGSGPRNPDDPLAFFPGYPTATGWLAGIDGAGGIGLVSAALTLTVVSGVICAYGLARLGERITGGSRRIGLILVALFAASPMAIVLSMVYAEAMFCAFAVWALIGVLERRWRLAGVCCAFAGLVRPTAAALILAVGLAALVAVLTRKDGWRPWLAGIVAPVGLIGYLAWVGVRTGRWDGWFAVQQDGWKTEFDGGRTTADWVRTTLMGERTEAFELATAVLIVGAVILAVIAVARRVEWPLLVYGIGVLAIDLLANGLMHSKVRLMVPAFTLLIPVAVALARRRTSTAVTVLGVIAVASAWFGAYSITVWEYAI